MTRTELIRCLRDLGACNEALEWIEKTPGELEDLWAACQRGSWMIWLLERLGYDKRTMRHIACDVAEDVLNIYEHEYPADYRPRSAIAMARRYADGAATDDELIAARDAARGASRAAVDVTSGAAVDAAASYAADAAVWAAASDAISYAAIEASRAAADAEDWAADSDIAGAAAWNAAMARHADMVRARVSWANVEQAIECRTRAEPMAKEKE